MNVSQHEVPGDTVVDTTAMTGAGYTCNADGVWQQTVQEEQPTTTIDTSAMEKTGFECDASGNWFDMVPTPVVAFNSFTTDGNKFNFGFTTSGGESSDTMHLNNDSTSHESTTGRINLSHDVNDISIEVQNYNKNSSTMGNSGDNGQIRLFNNGEEIEGSPFNLDDLVSNSSDGIMSGFMSGDSPGKGTFDSFEVVATTGDTT